MLISTLLAMLFLAFLVVPPVVIYTDSQYMLLDNFRRVPDMIAGRILRGLGPSAIKTRVLPDPSPILAATVFLSVAVFNLIYVAAIMKSQPLGGTIAFLALALVGCCCILIDLLLSFLVLYYYEDAHGFYDLLFGKHPTMHPFHLDFLLRVITYQGALLRNTDFSNLASKIQTMTWKVLIERGCSKMLPETICFKYRESSEDPQEIPLWKGGLAALGISLVTCLFVKTAISCIRRLPARCWTIKVVASSLAGLSAASSWAGRRLQWITAIFRLGAAIIWDLPSTCCRVTKSAFLASYPLCIFAALGAFAKIVEGFRVLVHSTSLLCRDLQQHAQNLPLLKIIEFYAFIYSFVFLWAGYTGFAIASLALGFGIFLRGFLPSVRTTSMAISAEHERHTATPFCYRVLDIFAAPGAFTRIEEGFRTLAHSTSLLCRVLQQDAQNLPVLNEFYAFMFSFVFLSAGYTGFAIASWALGFGISLCSLLPPVQTATIVTTAEDERDTATPFIRSENKTSNVRLDALLSPPRAPLPKLLPVYRTFQDSEEFRLPVDRALARGAQDEYTIFSGDLAGRFVGMGWPKNGENEFQARAPPPGKLGKKGRGIGPASSTSAITASA
ncbi:hypothetical protein C8R44DRAFT_981885 [Mycena epipterygia]|nr:hypothetical protein C8R44DRAFT_981885 [Mycena epipterygia]